MNERLTRAFQVVEQLQSWIENRDDLPTSMPYASLHYTANGVIGIEIGDFGLWNSELDGDEDMTLDYCRDSFLKQIEQFWPFLQEERSGVSDPLCNNKDNQNEIHKRAVRRSNP